MSRSTAPLLLVVAGLAAEARIVAGDGVLCVVAPPRDLARRLAEAAAQTTPGTVASFGLAGGLAADLAVGSLVIGTRVMLAERSVPCTESLAASLAQRLDAAGMRATTGALAGRDAPVLAAREKQALHRASGALAVDTESHLVAAFAERHGLPFAVLRAVCDTADRDLPPLALTALGPDGRLDGRAIGRELLARPGQLLLMPGTAFAAARAMRTLRRVRRLLGPRLGLVHLG